MTTPPPMLACDLDRVTVEDLTATVRMAVAGALRECDALEAGSSRTARLPRPNLDRMARCLTIALNSALYGIEIDKESQQHRQERHS